MARPTTCDPQCVTVIEHWNGAAWTRVTSPDPPSVYLNNLLGVSAAGTASAWAVGSTDYANTLIARWNGTAWS